MKAFFGKLDKLIAVTILAAGLVAGPVAAQTWEPNRPIQIIIPYPAGGGPDPLFNILSPELTKRLGQPVLLIHRPGGSTIIGTHAIARAVPDGHTLGLVTDQLVVNQILNKNLPYKADDLMPLTQLVEGYFVLVAGTNRGFSNLAELVAQAKANPDKFTHAIPGNASPHHLIMEGLSQAAGIRLKHVPYQGSAQMATDVMGGHVDMMMIGAVTAVAHAKSGKMIALASMSPVRLPLAPSIPTASEAGIPGFSSSYWYGLVTPKGTLPHIMARLNREFSAVLKMPEVKEKIAAINFFARPTTPGEFDTIIKRDADKYEKIITQSGIKLN